MTIKISEGNSKMGSIRSVSLPAVKTCRNDCECTSKCYARKLERIRKSVRESYQHNYEVLIQSPDIYWGDIRSVVKMSRFFRFHVSGDIPNKDYLKHMIETARQNEHCEILCFTKRYNIVNETMQELNSRGEILPSNLHLIFSAWRGLKMENPFRFPEAHVKYRDGTTTAGDNAYSCGGNCTECALTDDGCWTLRSGEQVVFNEH